MRYVIKLGMLFAVLASLSAASVQASGNGKKGEHMRITASSSSELNFNLPGGPGWEGYMLLKFGEQPAKFATFIARGEPGPPIPRPDGSYAGPETFTVVLDDGSFQIDSRFIAIPGMAGLFTLYETGTISGGRGAYEGMTGWVFSKGLFMSPADNPAMAEGFQAACVAQMHGHVVKTAQ